MRSMDCYPKAAMERAMKVQDVMLQAMAKKITWWQAAEILGISDRHMRRWRERYVEEGYNGLFDRRRGQPSRRRVAVATVEKVFALYREKYFDLNVQHFHEKLQAEHGIELSYTWVKQALQGAGLVARGRKRGVTEGAVPTGCRSFGTYSEVGESPSAANRAQPKSVLACGAILRSESLYELSSRRRSARKVRVGDEGVGELRRISKGYVVDVGTAQAE